MSDIQLAQQIARELAPYLDGINSRLQRLIEFQDECRANNEKNLEQLKAVCKAQVWVYADGVALVAKQLPSGGWYPVGVYPSQESAQRAISPEVV